MNDTHAKILIGLIIIITVSFTLFFAVSSHYKVIDMCKADCELMNGTYVRYRLGALGVDSSCICMKNETIKNIW